MNPLFCVGMEVQQSSHEVLDKAQGLTGHVPSFKLQQDDRKTNLSSTFALIYFFIWLSSFDDLRFYDLLIHQDPSQHLI